MGASDTSVPNPCQGRSLTYIIVSTFVTSGIEVMKSMFKGKNGHIAVRTNSVALAVAELEKNGFVCDMETAKYKGERMTAVYLKDEIGGFAVHLLQK